MAGQNPALVYPYKIQVGGEGDEGELWLSGSRPSSGSSSLLPSALASQRQAIQPKHDTLCIHFLLLELLQSYNNSSERKLSKTMMVT